MTFRIPMILNNEHFTGLGATILEAHIPYISCISVSDSLSFSFFFIDRCSNGCTKYTIPFIIGIILKKLFQAWELLGSAICSVT